MYLPNQPGHHHLEMIGLEYHNGGRGDRTEAEMVHMCSALTKEANLTLRLVPASRSCDAPIRPPAYHARDPLSDRKLGVLIQDE